MKKNKLLLIVIVFVFLLTPLLSITPVIAELDPQDMTSGERGSPLGDQLLISNDNSLTEVRPAVAYNSTNKEYLVVWHNDRPGNDDIRAQLIDENGQRIGSEFYISAGSGRNRNNPDVAYDLKNNQYLVVWEETVNHDIHGRRVSATGTVLDANDLIIRECPANADAFHPAVVYSAVDDQFLVVWHELSIITIPVLKIYYNIHGQLLTKNGVKVGSILIISADDGNSNWRVNPDVTVFSFFSTSYLVVWQQRDPSQDIYKIRGQLLNGSGGLSGSSIPITVGLGSATNPKAACVPTAPDNYRFLVTWEWDLAGNKDIAANPISYNGVPGGAIAIASSTDNEINPAIAGSVTADGYLIAWQDAWVSVPQNGFSFLGPAVVGREVSVTGDRGETQIIGAVDTNYPAVAGNWSGGFLTVYERTITGTHSGIWGRLWGSPLGNIYLPLIIR